MKAAEVASHINVYQHAPVFWDTTIMALAIREFLVNWKIDYLNLTPLSDPLRFRPDELGMGCSPFRKGQRKFAKFTTRRYNPILWVTQNYAYLRVFL